MSKYKILIVVNSDVCGVEYHRQLIPHYHLNSNYKEFDITQINVIESIPDSMLKDFQLVQFSRALSFHGNNEAIAKQLKKLSIKTVLDIDDHWNLSSTHLLYDYYKHNNIPKQITDSLRLADHITTTTGFFADKIKPFNKHITILPNAIDPDQPQFIPQPSKSNLTRFGWAGGKCHLQDIELLRDSFSLLHSDKSLKNWQLILAGFNTSDKMFFEFEKIFTSGYKILPDIYRQYLFKLSETGNEETKDMCYRRIWSKDVYNYAKGLNDMDVCLVPLKDDLFNNCKSQLKVIEAAFMRNAVIVSEVKPYTIECCNYENSIMIPPDKNKKVWHKAMKSLIENPGRIKELSESLYETVKEKYHIATVNKTRSELYKHLIND